MIETLIKSVLQTTFHSGTERFILLFLKRTKKPPLTTKYSNSSDIKDDEQET